MPEPALVDWNAPAAVMLWSEAKAVGFEPGGTLWKGTLADAVLYVLDLPNCTREQAEIVVSHDGGTRNSWLTLPDIEALAARPDYPRW
jgi:hypothetical protein